MKNGVPDDIACRQGQAYLWDEAGGFEGLVVVELVGVFEHLFYLCGCVVRGEGLG